MPYLDRRITIRLFGVDDRGESYLSATHTVWANRTDEGSDLDWDRWDSGQYRPIRNTYRSFRIRYLPELEGHDLSRVVITDGDGSEAWSIDSLSEDGRRHYHVLSCSRQDFE